MGTHMFSDREGVVGAKEDGPFTRHERTDFGWMVEGRRIQLKRAWGLRQQLIDISGLIGETVDGTVTTSMVALGVGSVALVYSILQERELTQSEVDQLMIMQDRARAKMAHLRSGGKWEDFRMKEPYVKGEGHKRNHQPKTVDVEDEPVQETPQNYQGGGEGPPTGEMAADTAAAQALKDHWFAQAGRDALMGRESAATRLMKALIELYPDE
jgi:hypothetical protein